MTNSNKKKIKIHHTSQADENKLSLRYAERILQSPKPENPIPKRRDPKRIINRK